MWQKLFTISYVNENEPYQVKKSFWKNQIVIVTIANKCFWQCILLMLCYASIVHPLKLQVKIWLQPPLLNRGVKRRPPVLVWVRSGERDRGRGVVEEALRPSDTVGPKATLRRSSFWSRDNNWFDVIRDSMNQRSVNRLCGFGNPFRNLRGATNRFAIAYWSFDSLPNFFRRFAVWWRVGFLNGIVFFFGRFSCRWGDVLLFDLDCRCHFCFGFFVCRSVDRVVIFRVGPPRSSTDGSKNGNADILALLDGNRALDAAFL